MLQTILHSAGRLGLGRRETGRADSVGPAITNPPVSAAIWGLIAKVIVRAVGRRSGVAGNSQGAALRSIIGVRAVETFI
jgi:hypothetical protein